MSRFVPYLAEEAIERDAASLIGEYERARCVTIVPPIPVEDIVEKYLKLRIEFDDMHARHNVPRPPNGQPDILGAIYGDGSIYGPQVRAVLDALLEKYRDEGVLNLDDANVLKVTPFTAMGSVVQLINAFGGKAGFEKAVHELQDALYQETA